MINLLMDLATKRLIKYIKVHMATRWAIRHGLMLLYLKDLMNVTQKGL